MTLASRVTDLLDRAEAENSKVVAIQAVREALAECDEVIADYSKVVGEMQQRLEDADQRLARADTVVEAAKAWRAWWGTIHLDGYGSMFIPENSLADAVDALASAEQLSVESVEARTDGPGHGPLPDAVEGCICSHTVHEGTHRVELNADADCLIHGEAAMANLAVTSRGLADVRISVHLPVKMCPDCKRYAMHIEEVTADYRCRECFAADSYHLDDDETCASCAGTRWVDDENWQPEDYERGRKPLRQPGSGRIPCGACNHGGWDVDDGVDSRAGQADEEVASS